MNDLNTLQGYENEVKKQTKEYFAVVEGLNISEDQKALMLNIGSSFYIGVDSHIEVMKNHETNTRSNLTKTISKAIDNDTELPSTKNIK